MQRIHIVGRDRRDPTGSGGFEHWHCAHIRFDGSSALRHGCAYFPQNSDDYTRHSTMAYYGYGGFPQMVAGYGAFPNFGGSSFMPSPMGMSSAPIMNSIYGSMQAVPSMYSSSVAAPRVRVHPFRCLTCYGRSSECVLIPLSLAGRSICQTVSSKAIHLLVDDEHAVLVVPLLFALGCPVHIRVDAKRACCSGAQGSAPG